MSTSPDDFQYDVFISYSHNDKDWVHGWLLPRLEAAGLRVCIDFRDFEPGLPSLVNMENAVECSRKTLIVLTPAWVESEWTTFESLLIQTDDPAGRRARMIPLRLKSCDPPKRIAMLTYVDFTQEAETDFQLQRLLAAIRGEPTSGVSPPPRERRPAAGPTSPLSPNPFTDTLAIRDPARFVGRQAELRRLRTILTGASVQLIGPPKIGKSSLLWRLRDLYVQDGWSAAFVDFQSFGKWDRLCETIVRGLGGSDHSWEGVKRAVAGRRVILLLDEFDLAQEYGFESKYCDRLRALLSAEGDLRVVTASRVPLKQILPDTGRSSPLYNVLLPMELGPLAEKEAKVLLMHPWDQAAVSFDEATCDELVRLSQCHPFKLQRAAFHRYEALADPLYDWRAEYRRELEYLL